MTQRCPECGSTDVTLVDPETAFCEACEFEGRAGIFEAPKPYSTVKITLVGPALAGGSYTSVLTDEYIDRLIAEGWLVHRIWRVDFDGEIFVTEDVR